MPWIVIFTYLIEMIGKVVGGRARKTRAKAGLDPLHTRALQEAALTEEGTAVKLAFKDLHILGCHREMLP